MLTVTRLDIADASVLIEGARIKAQEIGVPMCISIVDESGNLIAFERMDGGKITSVTISQDKAFTAAAAKKQRMNTMLYASQDRWYLVFILRWVVVFVLSVAVCQSNMMVRWSAVSD